MLLNQDTVLSFSESLAVLVPYTKDHVPRYNHWMQDDELLRLTGSDKLSLEEEYENMEDSQLDPDRLGFIILDASRDNDMAGDVNINLLDPVSEGIEDRNISEAAELDVMIAEKASRRKYLGRDALLMIMAFSRLHLRVNLFIVKVLDDNKASLNLFKNQLGFQEFKRVAAFNEVHLKLHVNDTLDQELDGLRAMWTVERFTESPYSVPAKHYIANDKGEQLSEKRQQEAKVPDTHIANDKGEQLSETRQQDAKVPDTQRT